jgi:hypothetical protein
LGVIGTHGCAEARNRFHLRPDGGPVIQGADGDQQPFAAFTPQDDRRAAVGTKAPVQGYAGRAARLAIGVQRAGDDDTAGRKHHPGNIINVAKAKPVCRWQIAQWQTVVRIGSALVALFTAPHRQRPVMRAIDYAPPR